MTDDADQHKNVELCPQCKLPGLSLDAPDPTVPHCACWKIANHMFVTPTGEEPTE